MTGFEFLLGDDGSPGLEHASGSQAKGGSENGWVEGFGLPSGCNGQVLAIAEGEAGEVYVGGLFESCGNVAARNIARYDPATESWPSLGTGQGNGVDDAVWALRFINGELYVGGDFDHANAGESVAASRVARWNGDSWSALGGAFGDGVNGSVFALQEYAGDLYAGGTFTEAYDDIVVPAQNLARWNGSAWFAVGAGGGQGVGGPVRALEVYGGELHVGGSFANVNVGSPIQARNVARWSGTGWAMLGAGGNGIDGQVMDLQVFQGSLYVAGTFENANVGAAVPANRIARWNGSAWSAVGSGAGNGASDDVEALAVAGTALYLAGSFLQVNVGAGLTARRVARWDGSQFSAVGSGGANGVNDDVFALGSAGPDLYLGGWFTRVQGGTSLIARSVVRWNGTDFVRVGHGSGQGVNYNVEAIAVMNGDIYVGGNFTAVGNIGADRVARWDGEAWHPLGTATSNGVGSGFDTVYALAVVGPDLYVGGNFLSARAGSSTAVNRVARWDGEAWHALGSAGGNGVNHTVQVLYADGADLYVGGGFLQANVGAPIDASCIARWDGSSWHALSGNGGQGVDSSVYAIHRFQNELYVGGNFSSANVGASVPAFRIARWSGSDWSPVGSGGGNGTGGNVEAFAVLGDSLYVGGSFGVVNVGEPVTAANLARWDGATWAAVGNDGGNGLNNWVFALHVAEGNLFAAGWFTEANGASASPVPASGIVRWDGAAWHSMGSGIRWQGGRALGGAASGPLFVGGQFGAAGPHAASNLAGFDVGALSVIFADGFESQ